VGHHPLGQRAGQLPQQGNDQACSSSLPPYRLLPQVLVRFAAVAVSAALFGYSLYYMVALLDPPTSSLQYWEDNDWN